MNWTKRFRRAELMHALETLDEGKAEELAAATIAGFAIATAAVR